MSEDDGWTKAFDADTPRAEVARLAALHAARAVCWFCDELDEDHPDLTPEERAQLVAAAGTCARQGRAGWRRSVEADVRRRLGFRPTPGSITQRDYHCGCGRGF